MSIAIHNQSHGRSISQTPAAKWDVRAAAKRVAQVVTPMIKEGCKIMLVIGGMLTIMAAIAALDVWMWLPRVNHLMQ